MLVNMNFLTSKDILPEKRPLEKAVTIKIFEYSPLHSELKKQTGNVRKQYQGLHKVYKHDKMEDVETINKKSALKKFNKSIINKLSINKSINYFHEYHDLWMLEEKIWTLNMILLTYHLRHMTEKNGIKKPR